MSTGKEGWLHHQSGMLKSWKKQWFSLQGSRLSYSEKPGKKEQGFIDLSQKPKVERSTEGKRHLLQIVTSTRTYVVSADSSKESDEWFTALSSVSPTSTTSSGESSVPAAVRKPCMEDYLVVSPLGKGSFGIVQLVRSKRDHKLYAMKLLEKKLLQELAQVSQTIIEKEVLFEVAHPFCVSAHATFQTPELVVMVLDYVPGGELFGRLKEEGKFNENRTRLYAAELVLAIGHLHSRGLIYRDLKPENILVDRDGHLKITDFGLVKSRMNGATSTTTTFCGTPEYVAPEMLQQKPYTKSVDWWSLGILIYEMLVGIPPFYDENTNRMYRRILSEEIEYPSDFPPKAQDLVNKLCDRTPPRRLGASERDVEEIKEHPFFESLIWENVLQRQYTPGWIPRIVNDQDTQFFDQEALEGPTREIAAETVVLASTQDQFKGFTCTDETLL
jgi:serine/threonine protein kinase